MQVHPFRTYILVVISSPTYTSMPSMVAPFSQHVWWQCCNHLGILSSTVLWNTSNLTFYFSFIFLLSIFLFFFWFYISFSFSFRTMKKAHDKQVTWYVTWYDVISLELDGRVWKMTSGHLEYTWWPWVRNEADMRL